MRPIWFASRGGGGRWRPLFSAGGPACTACPTATSGRSGTRPKCVQRSSTFSRLRRRPDQGHRARPPRGRFGRCRKASAGESSGTHPQEQVAMSKSGILDALRTRSGRYGANSLLHSAPSRRSTAACPRQRRTAQIAQPVVPGATPAKPTVCGATGAPLSHPPPGSLPADCSLREGCRHRRICDPSAAPGPGRATARASGPSGRGPD